MTAIVVGIVPSGGAFSLAISASGSTTLTRMVSGSSTVTTLYSGATGIPLFIDVGDGTPGPLASGSLYQYTLTDSNATFVSPWVQPSCILNVEQEPITGMMIRLIEGGLNSTIIPTTITSGVTVSMAMPLAGTPTLPLVVVNMDLMQQDNVPVGRDVEQQDEVTGIWTITGHVERIFRISVLANTAPDRDFYRDALVAIFNSLIRTVFAPLGLDVSHKFQVASGQVADDPAGMGPGFYYADVLCGFTGTLNITVTPNYGGFTSITVTARDSNGGTTTVIASG